MPRTRSSIHPRLQVTERPKTIFGQEVARLRKREIQAVLNFYNHTTDSRTHTKAHLLDLLGALERELPHREKVRVVQFIRHGGLLGGLSRVDVMQDTYENIKQKIKEEDNLVQAGTYLGDDDDIDDQMRLVPISSSNREELPQKKVDDTLVLVSVKNEDEEEEEQANLQKETRQSCVVCSENLLSAVFPARKITAACKHDSTICLNCLSNHLTAQIHEKAWDEIRCPICPEYLEQLDVRTFAKAKDFNRYLDLSLQAAVRIEPDYVLCQRLGCGKLQVHEGGEANNIVTCSYCHFKMCFSHQCPMHYGMTCAQFDAAQQVPLEANEISVEMIRNTYKFCPGKGCGVPIELESGCNHMTCNQCGHQFCYECLASWRDILRYDNSAHAITCRFHTNNIDYGSAQMRHEDEECDESEQNHEDEGSEDSEESNESEDNYKDEESDEDE